MKEKLSIVKSISPKSHALLQKDVEDQRPPQKLEGRRKQPGNTNFLSRILLAFARTMPEYYFDGEEDSD